MVALLDRRWQTWTPWPAGAYHGPLIGCQTPAHRYTPWPDDVSFHLAEEAIEFGEAYGVYLDPWQQLSVHMIMACRRNGDWVSFEVLLEVVRQQGKGEVTLVCSLYCLFVLQEPLQIFTAHEFDTAAEQFARARGVVEAYDDLTRHVKIIRDGSGKEGIYLRVGARLRYKARSTGSARGFTAPRLWLDEALFLRHRTMAAVRSIMLKFLSQGAAQMVATSSAGEPTDAAEVLRSLRGRVLAGESGEITDPSLAGMIWCAPEEAWDDLGNEDFWLQAAPAMGADHCSLDAYRALYRGQQDDLIGFAREQLGLWDSGAAAEVIPLKRWEALADPESQATGHLVAAVDTTPDRAVAAIGVAGRSDRWPDRTHVELAVQAAGTDWVGAAARDMIRDHGVKVWAVDPVGPAGSLIPDVQQAATDLGLQVTVVNAGSRELPDPWRGGVVIVRVGDSEMAAACGALYDAVVPPPVDDEGDWVPRVVHIGQRELQVALKGASKRVLRDAWAWNRKGSAPICGLVAATLAYWVALKPRARPRTGVVRGVR